MDNYMVDALIVIDAFSKKNKIIITIIKKSTIDQKTLYNLFGVLRNKKGGPKGWGGGKSLFGDSNVVLYKVKTIENSKSKRKFHLFMLITFQLKDFLPTMVKLNTTVSTPL